MTEQEAAFQAMLDADPADHGTRLVFADWLDEQGDPRGPGYRALGMNRRYPCFYDYWGISFWCYSRGPDCIPPDWWKLYYRTQKANCSRRESEDAAALAFAKLPPERQQELLRLVTAET